MDIQAVDSGKKRKKISTKLIVVGCGVAGLWGMVCIAAALFLFTSLPIQTASSGTDKQPTPVVENAEFIQTISEFERSPFCQKYICVAAATMDVNGGLDHPYTISSYPKSNEFFIEVITSKNMITIFGVTLDPKTITSTELEFIEDFLTSTRPQKVDPALMSFIEKNVSNDINQICDAESMKFGSRNIWVGKVGQAPTIMVASSCPK